MLGTQTGETLPNKNVIQGMDLVYSQTKSGRPKEKRRAAKARLQKLEVSLFFEFKISPNGCQLIMWLNG